MGGGGGGKKEIFFSILHFGGEVEGDEWGKRMGGGVKGEGGGGKGDAYMCMCAYIQMHTYI